MIHRSLSYDPTPEHRISRTKWSRGFAVVYGTILLLLLTFIAAHRLLNGPNAATEIAGEYAAPPAANNLLHAN